jgi:hypothetical protein
MTYSPCFAALYFGAFSEHGVLVLFAFFPCPRIRIFLCGVDTALAPWALRLLCTERNSVPLGFFTDRIVKEQGK